MFEKRRQRILDEMGPDAVALFVGARLVARSNDTQFPFRQDSDFWYLTGFGHPEAIAVLRTDDGPAFTLFVQPRDPLAETWTGYRPGVDGAREQYGADAAHDIAEFGTELPKILQGARRLYHILGRNAEIDRRIVEIQENLRQRSKQGQAPIGEILDPRSILHEMRLVKQPEELELMRRASAISLEGHAAAARIAKPGIYEYELEAALAHEFRRHGAAGAAYNVIVGGGANAAILHYIRNDQPLRAREMVLIDAGAEFESYASDVTRTYPVEGRFEGEHRAVYEVVLAAQEKSLDACHPGTTLPEIHQLAVRTLTEGLVDLGVLSGNLDELVSKEAYRPYYMHGTSHWLGLDVHDCGIYARGEVQRSLEPGMVFTVEPGLYFAPNAEGKFPESLRGLGVRIEDDVVITEGGHENLNAGIPKRPDDVEAWMRA